MRKHRTSTKVFQHLVLATLLATNNSGFAWSVEPDYSVKEIGSFRIGIFAGAFLPNQLDWNGQGTITGLPFSAQGKITLHNGPIAGALIGYSINDYIGADLNVGSISSDLEKLDGIMSLPSGAISGSFSLAGNLRTIFGFLNVIVTPFGGGRFSPYVGAGPGVTFSRAKLRSVNLGLSAMPINSKSSEADFAIDAILGIDFKLTPKLELGASYEYVWINTRELGSGAGIAATTGGMSGHILNAVLEYHF